MKTTKERLPDEEVKIKLSICPKCNGFVTVAVGHKLTGKLLKDFYKDVKDYNLDVKTMSLLEYRDLKPEMCNCED